MVPIVQYSADGPVQELYYRVVVVDFIGGRTTVLFYWRTTTWVVPYPPVSDLSSTYPHIISVHSQSQAILHKNQHSHTPPIIPHIYMEPSASLHVLEHYLRFSVSAKQHSSATANAKISVKVNMLWSYCTFLISSLSA